MVPRETVPEALPGPSESPLGDRGRASCDGPSVGRAEELVGSGETPGAKVTGRGHDHHSTSLPLPRRSEGP